MKLSGGALWHSVCWQVYRGSREVWGRKILWGLLNTQALHCNWGRLWAETFGSWESCWGKQQLCLCYPCAPPRHLGLATTGEKTPGKMDLLSGTLWLPQRACKGTSLEMEIKCLEVEDCEDPPSISQKFGKAFICQKVLQIKWPGKIYSLAVLWLNNKLGRRGKWDCIILI